MAHRKQGQADFEKEKFLIRSICVHQFLPGVFDKGPESLLLVLVSEYGLDCLITKVDQFISA